MLRYATLSLMAGAAALTMLGGTAEAAKKKKPVRSAAEAGESRDARSSYAYHNNGTRVRGFVWRRGGYSFSAADTINTYGDTQSRYSSTSMFRNYDFGRQTSFGPFDSDFFFDSGVSPRGGNSPYP